MPKHDDCDIRPGAGATQKELNIAHDAAISRLRPIQDGVDDWEFLIGVHRSNADTGVHGPAPDQGGTLFSQSREGLCTKTSNGSMMAMPGAGCKWDRRVRIHARPLTRVSDGAEGTVRGPPA
jgi:hypothetical protein